MRFGRKHSKMTVFMAMLHGIVIGVIAIFIVGFIFLFTDGKKPIDQIEEEIPTSGPTKNESGHSTNEATKDEELPRITFYAKQHGVFSRREFAETFIAEHSSLSTAAIFSIDRQYFVWSAVSKKEENILNYLDDETFKKPLFVYPNRCEEIPMKLLWEVLQADDLSKIKFSNYDENEEIVLNFKKKFDAITAFTNDLMIIHLHLLSAYSAENSCVKISF